MNTDDDSGPFATDLIIPVPKLREMREHPSLSDAGDLVSQVLMFRVVLAEQYKLNAALARIAAGQGELTPDGALMVLTLVKDAPRIADGFLEGITPEERDAIKDAAKADGSGVKVLEGKLGRSR